MNIRAWSRFGFYLVLVVALLVALAVLAFNLSATLGFWVTLALFVGAYVVNGLIIRHEDKQPGSFYNPKRKEQEPKAH